MNVLFSSRLVRSLIAFGAAGFLSSAQAGTVTYTGPNYGTWNSPTFWSNGIVPGTGEDVKIVSASSADFWVSGNTPYSQPGIGTLLLNNSGGGFVVADVSKNLVVSGSTTLGSLGYGAIEQAGGTHSHAALILGASTATDFGIYTLEKGNLNTGSIVAGGVGGGEFNQVKGNVTVANTLTVGRQSTTDSIYRLINGKLTVEGATVIGGAGDGYYEQTKGTATLGALTLGNDVTGGGSFKQFGGTVRTDSVTVGKAGEGFYGIASGVHSVTGDLTLGGSSGGTGIYQIEGGTLEIGGKILIGGSGDGGFAQSGGKVSANGGVEVRDGEYQLENSTLTTKGLSVAAGSHLTTEGTKSIIRTSGNIAFDSAATITTRDATLSVVKGSSISLSAVQADAGASSSALTAAKSWNAITLEKDVTLTLQGTAGVDAVYVNSLNIGSKDPFRVESIITGNGVNMYYNVDLKSNKYLKGDTYDLVNGGQLIPVHGTLTTSSSGSNWEHHFGGTLGIVGIVKDGSGTLTFSGSNTYVGGTTVIGGTGALTGSTNGFNLAPGNSTDVLSVGNFDFGGTFEFVDLTGSEFFATEDWALNGFTFSAFSFLSGEVAEASGTLAEREFGTTPSTVPEPTSALLALLGSAALLARRTRR